MREILTALFVVTSLTIGAAAQEPKPAAEAQQPTTRGEQPATRGEPANTAQRPATTQAAKVTIGGCIQAAPAAASASNASAISAIPAESKFELASAKVVSGGPVGTTGNAAVATRYRLEGDEKTISPHLNHQVEITGTIGPAGTGASVGAGAAPMLKVESLKMIAAKCS